MKYYPINLDIRGKTCLVVGGGGVGTRKIKTLSDCGAMVILVSPQADKTLIDLADAGKIEWRQRTYQSSDLDGVFLVIGATDNDALNRQIHSDARQLDILCNIADSPELCNFIVPSTVRRGDLIISVSTSGKSPAFAKFIRKELEKQFDSQYGNFLRLMGAVRKQLLAESHTPQAHKQLFERLIEEGLLQLMKTGQTEDIDRLLLDVLGKGYTFESLMKTDYK
jgi:precorrin-2 dehydrogenase/sirohydrochlorin ferrochelatase